MKKWLNISIWYRRFRHRSTKWCVVFRHRIHHYSKQIVCQPEYPTVESGMHQRWVQHPIQIITFKLNMKFQCQWFNHSGIHHTIHYGTSINGLFAEKNEIISIEFKDSISKTLTSQSNSSNPANSQNFLHFEIHFTRPLFGVWPSSLNLTQRSVVYCGHSFRSSAESNFKCKIKLYEWMECV